MTPEPGASLFERLREVVADLVLLQHALERMAEKDEERAQLSKTVAARAGALAEELRGDVALLPRGRGRPLAENAPNFRQKVKMLHEEKGWGRARIARAMRVSEWQVRRVLEEQAGGKSSARRGPS